MPDRISVFESMIAFGKCVFRLDDHLDRLFQSAKTAGIQIKKNKEQVRKELLGVLNEHSREKEICVRLTILQNQTLIFLSESSWPKEIYQKGVDLVTTTVRRNHSNAIPPEAKTGEFLNGVLAILDPPAHDAFETLFLDQNGYVKEARVWNFFIVAKGVLCTPPTDGILDGVTRRFVIECARKERFRVEEKQVTRHEIWNADEAFITNTSGKIVPVRSLDQRIIGSKMPGLVTQKLMERFEIELKNEINQV